MRNKKKPGITIAAGLAAVLLLAGLLFARFTAKKVKAPPVEVPEGFELMEISALAKARKIEILSNGSTAEAKADEESGGLLFSGTPSEIGKIVVRWKKDVDFGSCTAGWLVINALCGEEAGASVKAVLDSSYEASVKAAVREADGAWNGEKNNCCDIHSQQLSGRHALSLRVDFEEGAAEKPVTLLLKNVLFLAYSLPVAEVNIDESRGTIADMNSDHAHKTMCYGSMTLHIPEGYRSEFMKEEGATQTFELDYIRGRGNTTWNTDKKPYKIKLKEPAPLLGLGANTQWGLLANYYDISLIRNRYTYWLGDRIGMECVRRDV